MTLCLGPSGPLAVTISAWPRVARASNTRAYMTEQPRTASRSTASRGTQGRPCALVVLLAIVALVLTSSALNWVTEASAADGGPQKAVIVAGPVHSLTDKYHGYAAAIADAAERAGHGGRAHLPSQRAGLSREEARPGR